ncbi:MAG: heme exporter protein CcmD [Sphingobium sp.]|mgnify:CR=1 FL=1|nr:heme exporter protein CcmD [Sphingobium sp.]MBP6112330.1 heme exporter protein CcmD [Sphingobium sp.]MBP8670083.1 heme exporter protein CcmD [Sphingobium sp.]MBP9157412.1 heme exporter protein CcmD [Sphingobium sp.]MCC6482317.1 heme exporter protein CcmD [Sphingomonadaceae bacterium]
MNHWPFIIAAYVLTALGVAGISWASWRTMRAAEKRAEHMKQARDRG